jgi:hypothetical protein
MVKAYVLVVSGRKKLKLFVTDIRKLCILNKRKTPAIPCDWAKAQE